MSCTLTVAQSWKTKKCANKMSRKLRKILRYFSWVRHFFCVTVFAFNLFSTRILWKLANTRNPTLNSYISKTRTNSEQKLKFSESSFKFLQNNVLFRTIYPPGYTAGGSNAYNSRCRCQLLAAFKDLR